MVDISNAFDVANNNLASLYISLFPSINIRPCVIRRCAVLSAGRGRCSILIRREINASFTTNQRSFLPSLPRPILALTKISTHFSNLTRLKHHDCIKNVLIAHRPCQHLLEWTTHLLLVFLTPRSHAGYTQVALR